MKLNLFYQTYCRQHFSSDDFFNNILSKIDKTYTHTVSPVKTFYIPIDIEELQTAKDKGRLVVYLGPDQIPNLVAKQIVVSFSDIGDDFIDVRDHLITEYGNQATKCEIFDEIYLNEIN